MTTEFDIVARLLIRGPTAADLKKARTKIETALANIQATATANAVIATQRKGGAPDPRHLIAPPTKDVTRNHRPEKRTKRRPDTEAADEAAARAAFVKPSAQQPKPIPAPPRGRTDPLHERRPGPQPRPLPRQPKATQTPATRLQTQLDGIDSPPPATPSHPRIIRHPEISRVLRHAARPHHRRLENPATIDNRHRDSDWTRPRLWHIDPRRFDMPQPPTTGERPRDPSPARRPEHRDDQERQRIINQGIIAIGKFDTAATTLAHAFTTFASTAPALTAALNAMPRSVDHHHNHTHEVHINGAHVLAELEPSIKRTVNEQTTRKIAETFRRALPDAPSPT